MSLHPWGDDSPLPHGDPITGGQALALGLILIVAILCIAVPGCAEFVVAVAS